MQVIVVQDTQSGEILGSAFVGFMASTAEARWALMARAMQEHFDIRTTFKVAVSLGLTEQQFLAPKMIQLPDSFTAGEEGEERLLEYTDLTPAVLTALFNGTTTLQLVEVPLWHLEKHKGIDNGC